MARICYHCFRNIQDSGACPYCGYNDELNTGLYPLALPAGSVIGNRFYIGRVLGQGSYGITYIAYDNQIRARVAIKEYLPVELATRDPQTLSLRLYSGERSNDFEFGKQQFLDETKSLAEVSGHDQIVRINNYFEYNGTVYCCQEYVDGFNLQQYMQHRGGPLPIYTANQILFPVMEALDWVHSKGILHLDLSPDSIMIRRDGSVKIIDFGVAKYNISLQNQNLDAELKRGFAPIELYGHQRIQGPYTDVYALAATYYYAVTGKVPSDSMGRKEADNLQMPSSLGAKIRKRTEKVLFKALSVAPQDRYQTMAVFYQAMLETMPMPFAKEAEEDEALIAKKASIYEKGNKKQLKGDLKGAVQEFSKIRDFRDSEARINRCNWELENKKNQTRNKKETEDLEKQLAQTKHEIEKNWSATGENNQIQSPSDGQRQDKAENRKNGAKRGKGALFAILGTAVIVAAIVLFPRITGTDHVISSDSGSGETVSEEITSNVPQDLEPAEEINTETGNEPEETAEMTEEETPAPVELPEEETVAEVPAAEEPAEVTITPEPELEESVEEIADAGSTAVEEPTAKEPAAEEPAAENPAVEEPADEMTIEETVVAKTAEEPAAEAQATEESAAGNPAAEEPTEKQPVIEEPAEENTIEETAAMKTADDAESEIQEELADSSVGTESTDSILPQVEEQSLIPEKENNTDTGRNEEAENVEKDSAYDRNDYTGVGNIVVYGSYEQDGNPDNGKEDLEWIVLAVEENQSLLISRYAIDCLAYNSNHSTFIRWEQSSLRKWLNDSFLSEAFSSTEETDILMSSISNWQDRNGSRDTTDKVFLLSKDEVEEYLQKADLECCAPTDYAAAKGLRPNNESGNCCWWLRSPGGASANQVYYFAEDGTLMADICSEELGIRPAIWIQYER